MCEKRNASRREYRCTPVNNPCMTQFGDYLKIKIQLLQFQTDVSSARLAKVQALVGLREFLGYNAVPADYGVVGDLEFQPLKGNLDDLQVRALRERPDFRAAELGITAAQSQILLAKANAKVDVNGTYDFTHVSGENTASIFANFQLPIFNRNQGEIARTGYALTQAQEQRQSASDTVRAHFWTYWPASELRGNNLVELRMNANSEVT